VAYAVGDWTTAGRWARFADSFFPGNWLNEAFVAQQAAIEGRPDEAARRYADIANRTNAPEVMDALAHLLRLQGKAGKPDLGGPRRGDLDGTAARPARGCRRARRRARTGGGRSAPRA
jgi:hypothetical protein